MIDRVGTCRWCGQTRMVKLPEDAAPVDADREAVMQCNCEGARQIQKTETKIAVAQNTIKNKMIIKEELRDALLLLTELTGHEYIDSVSVKKAGTTITIKNAKDSINVEKKIVTVESHKG